MNKKLGLFVTLTILLVSIFSIAGVAAQVPVSIDKVYINDILVEDGEVRDLTPGPLTVLVKLTGDGNFSEDLFDDKPDATLAENVRVTAEIEGSDLDSDDVRARTNTFDVKVGETYTKEVTLNVPNHLDQDRYVLSIRVSDRKNVDVEKTFILDFNREQHSVVIKDVLFSPGTEVEAGRSLLAEVRLRNYGEDDEEDLKVTLNLEGVGADSDFIDEIEEDEQKSSEQLYVRIPVCTAPGQYTATVTVDYDENTRSESETFTVTVLGSDRCQATAEERTVITVGPESQNIVAGGSEATYPIAVTNEGSNSRTYTVSVNTGDWATTRLSSNVLTVGAGETKLAFAYVKANAAAPAGDQLVNVVVASGGETLKEVTLRANVVQSNASATSNLRQGLQVGLVVLVVLLVIVGLIVGFSRLRGDEDGNDETYY